MKNEATLIEGLSSILAKNGSISKEEAGDLATTFQGAQEGNFVNFLLKQGLVDRDALLDALSEYYQVPAFDVMGYFFETHYLRMFPKDFLLRNNIIPFDQDENILVVVASEPDNPNLLSAIGHHVSYDIQFFVGIQLDIEDAVKEFYDESLTTIEQDQDIRDEEHQLERKIDEIIHEEE